MGAVSGNKAAIYICSGVSTPFLDAATSADGGRLKYTLTDASKRRMDPRATTTVETSPDGSTWTPVAASAFTMHWAIGQVEFPTARAVGTQVRMSGGFFTASKLGGGHDFSLDVDVSLSDSTEFGLDWKTFDISDRTATASIGKFWIDEFFFTELGGMMLLSLYPDQATTARYEAYAYMTKDSVKAARASLVDESLAFQVVGEVLYVAA